MCVLGTAVSWRVPRLYTLVFKINTRDRRVASHGLMWGLQSEIPAPPPPVLCHWASLDRKPGHLLLYPGPFCDVDLRAQAVLLEESLKRFALPLLFHQRAYHFRDQCVPLPTKNPAHKEILDSSLRKEATVMDLWVWGFLFFVFGWVVFFLFLWVFFFLFCFDYHVALVVWCSCQNRSGIRWTCREKSWSKCISLYLHSLSFSNKEG